MQTRVQISVKRALFFLRVKSLVYETTLFLQRIEYILFLATELNTIVIAYLTWKQIHLLKDSKDAHENW
jgi:hypothetical protein